MPRLLNDSDMNVSKIPGLSGFEYSSIRPERMTGRDASEYTLVTLVVDESWSVGSFRTDLVDTLQKAIGACSKSPRKDNLLVRMTTFNNDVTEIHGFKPLSDIVLSDYDRIRPHGGTALYDAVASAVGAMSDYGSTLADQDYSVNGILFVLTDGDNNASKFTASTVKDRIAELAREEKLDSFVSVLVGINAKEFEAKLRAFQQDAGITQYLDAGDATPGNLAKLAAFVSRSVSSQANAMAGGPALQSASLTI